MSNLPWNIEFSMSKVTVGKTFSQAAEIIFLSTSQTCFIYFYFPFLKARDSDQPILGHHVSTKTAQQKGFPCLWLNLPLLWRLLTLKGSHDDFDRYILLSSGNAWHSQETKAVSPRCGCQKDTIYRGLESSEACEIKPLQEISVSQPTYIHLCLHFICFQYSLVLKPGRHKLTSTPSQCHIPSNVLKGGVTKFPRLSLNSAYSPGLQNICDPPASASWVAVIKILPQSSPASLAIEGRADAQVIPRLKKLGSVRVEPLV